MVLLLPGRSKCSPRPTCAARTREGKGRGGTGTGTARRERLRGSAWGFRRVGAKRSAESSGARRGVGWATSPGPGASPRLADLAWRCWAHRQAGTRPWLARTSIQTSTLLHCSFGCYLGPAAFPFFPYVVGSSLSRFGLYCCFFFNYTLQLRRSTRTHIHPYKHTNVNLTFMSTFERLR